MDRYLPPDSTDRLLPPRTFRPGVGGPSRASGQWSCFAPRVVLAVVLGLLSNGCTQMAVVGKMLVGDPKVDSMFSQMTGKSLEKGAKVAVVVTAPDAVLSEYDSVAVDVQDELERLMSRRKINVVDSDKVTAILSREGGSFDPQLVAESLEVDYVLHVDIEFFDHRVPNSSQLYHGRSGGNVYGYEVTEEAGSSLGKHARKVFEREFESEYPGQHPVPADRTPERVFRNRFIDSLSAELGRMFYDFRTQEAF